MDSGWFHHSREINDLREKLKASRTARDRARRRNHGRTQDIEADVAFLTLFSRALLDILVERNVCTLDEVGERMNALDILDGEADHGLDTKVVAEELGVERPVLDERKRFAKSARAARKIKQRKT